MRNVFWHTVGVSEGSREYQSRNSSQPGRLTAMGLPAIVPMPPLAEDVGLPWDVVVADPIAAST